MTRLLLVLLAVIACEAVMVITLYGSGALRWIPAPEFFLIGVPFLVAAVCSWTILSRLTKMRRRSACALSAAIAFVGLYAGMFVSLNTWGS
jgi:hypothetical protein